MKKYKVKYTQSKDTMVTVNTLVALCMITVAYCTFNTTENSKKKEDVYNLVRMINTCKASIETYIESAESIQESMTQQIERQTSNPDTQRINQGERIEIDRKYSNVCTRYKEICNMLSSIKNSVKEYNTIHNTDTEDDNEAKHTAIGTHSMHASYVILCEHAENIDTTMNATHEKKIEYDTAYNKAYGIDADKISDTWNMHTEQEESTQNDMKSSDTTSSAIQSNMKHEYCCRCGGIRTKNSSDTNGGIYCINYSMGKNELTHNILEYRKQIEGQENGNQCKTCCE